MVISQSPGRINIIGEHTDYNEGFVLPAAIDKKSIFKLKKNGNNEAVRVRAANLKEQFSFDLTNFQPLPQGWQNYIMGVVRELQNLGAGFTGFEGEFSGDVPIGSGMSSSAALECSLAFGLNELFDLGFDRWQLIKACQLAEHHFAGIQCGIMDQFASVMGKKDQVMLLDCRSLEFKYYPFDLGKYQLLLLNTNVSHTLSSSAYNTRREECGEGVYIIQKKYPDITSLRDVRINMLQHCRSEMRENIFSRCRHVVTENQRVLAATEALTNHQLDTLGQLMYQSHFSLQNDYKVSCPELDYLVELTLDKDYILGSRMMGGGFGGCTINLIEKSQTDAFINWAAEQYRQQFGISLSPYLVSIEDGAGLVD